MVCRSAWRSRRRSLVLLAVLTSVVGAVALGSLSSASRTGSVLDRARASAESTDAGVFGAADVVGRVIALEEVVDAAEIADFPGLIDGTDRFFGVAADPAGVWLSRLDRPRLISGEFPDPGSPDEITVTEPTASALGLAPGDHVRVRFFVGHELGPARDLVVAGVTRDVDDVVAPSTGRAYGTPAFAASFERTDSERQYLVRLRPGVDVGTFEAHARAAAPEVTINDKVGELRRVSHALDLLRVGVMLFGVAAAVAGMLTLLLMIDHDLRRAAIQADVLRALGFTRRQFAVCLALVFAPVALIGAVVAAAVAIVTSRAWSFGLAARLEPDRGVNVDSTIVAVGPVVLAITVFVGAACLAWRRVRPAAVRLRRAPSTLARLATRVGASPPIVAGVRLAVGGTRAVDRVRPAFAATAIGVAGVIAVATVGASLERTSDTPGRYGLTWDAVIAYVPEARAEVIEVLDRSDDVDGFSEWRVGDVVADGRSIPAFSVHQLGGDVSLSVIDGRRPAEPGDVVLGKTTARQLRVEVGDTFVARELGEREYRVVGLAVFPTVGFNVISEGIWFAAQEFEDVVADASESEILVRWGPMVHGNEAARQLEQRLPAASIHLEMSPRPLEVAEVARTTWVLWALGALLAVLAAAALVHALLLALSHRRRDVAALRALGFVTRQLSSMTVTGALVIVSVGTLIGLPLGTALGIAVWRALANDIGVAPDPMLPFTALIGIGLLALALAALLALLAARHEVRQTPAVVLAAE